MPRDDQATERQRANRVRRDRGVAKARHEHALAPRRQAPQLRRKRIRRAREGASLPARQRAKLKRQIRPHGLAELPRAVFIENFHNGRPDAAPLVRSGPDAGKLRLFACAAPPKLLFLHRKVGSRVHILSPRA